MWWGTIGPAEFTNFYKWVENILPVFQIFQVLSSFTGSHLWKNVQRRNDGGPGAYFKQILTEFFSRHWCVTCFRYTNMYMQLWIGTKTEIYKLLPMCLNIFWGSDLGKWIHLKEWASRKILLRVYCWNLLVDRYPHFLGLWPW